MGLRSNLQIWRGPAALASDAAARRGRSHWRSLAGVLVAWIVLGTVWEVGARIGILNAAILPPPSQFIPYLIETSGSVGLGVNKVSYAAALVETVIRVGVGFGFGVGSGLIVGTLLSAIPWARVIGVPIAQILAPIAPIAWIPLAIVLFGTGDGAAVFVVFMGITASMTLATVAALGGVPGEYIKSARSLGSKGWRLWLRVILPAAAPGVATAIRLSFFAAWMSVLAGEMAGINSGLGSLVILGQQEFQMKLVMAGLVTIGILGFGFDRFLLLVRQRLLWWESRGARVVAADA
ncbi:MAG: ABC transporter permease subunit [Chloroflexi bacterium]|nr:MAG: ABC transporter permease subunit [Chloroflexota bacterium]